MHVACLICQLISGSVHKSTLVCKLKTSWYKEQTPEDLQMRAKYNDFQRKIDKNKMRTGK